MLNVLTCGWDEGQPAFWPHWQLEEGVQLVSQQMAALWKSFDGGHQGTKFSVSTVVDEPPGSKLLEFWSGKLPRGHLETLSMGCLQVQIHTWAIQTILALSDIIEQKGAYKRGSVNNHDMDILLDLGAPCSVILKDFFRSQVMKLATPIKPINVDGRNILPVGTATLKVCLGEFEANQQFIVVDNLSAPAIIGGT